MLDLQLEDGVGEGVAPKHGGAVPHAVRTLAQGIHCGDFLLAFGFDWARQIVDQFELVPMPRAPSWVLGAVNVNGVIVPVVDLSNYFSASTLPAQLERGQRLLVGGIQDEDAESALAVVFSQTPVQLDYQTSPWVDLRALPTRLQEVCSGVAGDDQGQAYAEINPRKLMDALSAELSVI